MVGRVEDITAFVDKVPPQAMLWFHHDKCRPLVVPRPEHVTLQTRVVGYLPTFLQALRGPTAAAQA